MATHEYVKYIQYTLGAAGFYTKAIDGDYGSSTASAVRSFQIANNQRYIDGKVDSETKWYLAKYWLNLIVTNNQLFESWKTFASEDIRKYIQKVEEMGLAPDIGSGKTYRKTTFTGVAGPSLASDVIFFEIPQSVLSVEKIIIVPDQDIRWRNYKAISFGWHSSFSTNIFEYPNIEALDLSAVSTNIEIPMNGRSAESVRYVWVNLVGGGIYGLGQGEGFGISEINVAALVQDPDITQVVDYEDPIRINVKANFITSLNDVTPSSPALINISNVERVSAQQTQYVSSLSYSPDGVNQRELTFTSESGVNLNSVDYLLTGEYEIKIPNFRNNVVAGTFSLQNLTLSDTTSLGQTVSGSPISIRQTQENNVILETSSTFYGDALTRTTEIDLSSGYRLKNRLGQIFPEGKNSINYGDGILLLCDSNGKPIGLPTLAQISASVSNPQTFSQEERDIAYGYFSLVNELPSDGFRYGFYDLSTQELLGHSLSYVDFYTRSSFTNFENIYIAVCALDSDGANGDNEFVGQNNSTTFIPTRIPLKYLTPIYSVKHGGGSAVQINNISANLSKFDAWELPVSNGSFNKKIKIKSSVQYTDWKSIYSGQEMLAEYSTMDLSDVSWSKIYGYGYYDVVNENPLIIDSKSIKLRRTPILSWNHKTDYRQSIGGIVRQEVNIYTRSTIDSPWVKVDDSLISDVDCENGLIKFKKRIIPSETTLVKVDYSTINKNSLVRHINGTPIPLNPFLNSDSIQFDEPMYVYLTPKNIYKKNSPNQSDVNVFSYEKVTEFQYSNPVNFTYSSTIFDETSIDYDPFALCVAIIYVTNNPNKVKPKLFDLRLRGGGIKADIENSDIINEVPEILSHWDTYPASGTSYMNGGYVIIRVPENVKQNFTSPQEIYNIIRNNLTAGIVFDLQNMEGEDWS